MEFIFKQSDGRRQKQRFDCLEGRDRNWISGIYEHKKLTLHHNFLSTEIDI